MGAGRGGLSARPHGIANLVFHRHQALSQRRPRSRPGERDRSPCIAVAALEVPGRVAVGGEGAKHPWRGRAPGDDLLRPHRAGVVGKAEVGLCHETRPGNAGWAGSARQIALPRGGGFPEVLARILGELRLATVTATLARGNPRLVARTHELQQQPPVPRIGREAVLDAIGTLFEVRAAARDAAVATDAQPIKHSSPRGAADPEQDQAAAHQHRQQGVDDLNQAPALSLQIEDQRAGLTPRGQNRFMGRGSLASNRSRARAVEGVMPDLRSMGQSRRLRTAVFLLAPPLAGVIVALLLAAALGSARAEPAPPTSLFRDVAALRGIHGPQAGISTCAFNAAGAAWGDADGDDDLDLFLPRQEGASRLWAQRSDGTFADHARRSGLDLAGIATAAAFGDYDEDGDQDLYVGGAGPDQLFQNDGRGHFTDVALLAGTQNLGTAMAVSWVDFDGDGRLDVHVANGDNCTDDPPPAPNRLYRNVGNGRFADVSGLLPLTAASGITLDAVWLDYDFDGDQDLYLGNDDLDGQGNALLANTGRGFRDVSERAGAGLSRFTMGVAAGDIDGDGRPDLTSTDIGREALLVGDAAGGFAEQAQERGFGRERVAGGRESITWGVALADFDLDADLDAFAAGGALGSERSPHDDALYLNDGDGRFDSFTVPAPGSGRSVAPADFDRDGDIDLLVAQLGGSPMLLENRRARGHWIELRLLGSNSVRDACGAQVRLLAAGRQQWRQVECRTGDRVLHFGLGAQRRVDRVQIAWPSGRRQILGPLAADRLQTVVEPR